MNFIQINSTTPLEAIKNSGGKARGLFELIKAGANVPKTVVIPHSADVETAVKHALESLRQSGANPPYAVRSSANVEDGANLSYAGQFESFLNLSDPDEIIDAARKCRSIIPPEDYAGEAVQTIKINVIVQQMVDADTAGVLFTCDPITGSRSHIIMEAISGAAGDLMSGKAPGCRAVLSSRGEIFSRDPHSCISAEQAVELAGEAVKIEKKLIKAGYLKGPTDFEWAIKEETVYWLQARPVTAMGVRTAPSDNEEIVFIKPGQFPECKENKTLWTSMNAREALPGAVSPLTETMFLPIINSAFTEFYKSLGINPNENPPGTFLKCFKGRAFLGITSQKQILKQMPFKNPDEIIEQGMFGHTSAHPEIKLSLSLFTMLPKIAYREIVFNFQFEPFMKKEWKTWHYPKPEELKNKSTQQLFQKVVTSMDFNYAFGLHIIGTMRYMTAFSLLEKLCRKYDEDPSELIQGTGKPLFAASAAELQDLAHEAEKVKDKLFDADLKPMKYWNEIIEKEEAGDFGNSLHRFLDKFGHLGSGSVDFYCKSWREEPRRVMKIIGDILKKGDARSREEYLAQLRSKRDLAINRLKQKVSFLDGLKLPLYLKVMHAYAPLRENVKFMLQRRLYIFKEYIKEIGRRLVKEKVFDNVDDVFFLKKEELAQLAENPEDRHELTKQRRSDHARLSTLPCPVHRIESNEGSSHYYTLSSDSGGVFHGVAGSAGTFTGPARILLNIDEAHRLTPGDVLVTTTTDPSWTPLFSVAGAVVAEMGSMLSHGAVVAREAGIPAVLNVSGVISAIRDGDILFIDGTKGIVIIEKADEE